ncbi:hypothetical protein F2Q70_00011999 [Brassica cretica]|uniref:Uncharacterized protein n=1 Tax=Brassica cretica TaxID=69181 RepID=A0A8S9M0Q5_BRACR|nr:hypothetical protein F2Q70_00011999 [Brassica cretica]
MIPIQLLDDIMAKRNEQHVSGQVLDDHQHVEAFQRGLRYREEVDKGPTKAASIDTDRIPLNDINKPASIDATTSPLIDTGRVSEQKEFDVCGNLRDGETTTRLDKSGGKKRKRIMGDSQSSLIPRFSDGQKKKVNSNDATVAAPSDTLARKSSDTVARKSSDTVARKSTNTPSTDETMSLSVDNTSSTTIDFHFIVSIDTEQETKLISNLIELNFACLGAWYTWDRILQTSLEEVMILSIKSCESLLFSNLFQRDCPSVLLEDKQKGTTMKRGFLGSSKKELADSHTIRKSTREESIETLQAASIDSVNQASNDTFQLVSGNTVHNGTIHSSTVHRGTVHLDTIHHASIDTVPVKPVPFGV